MNIKKIEKKFLPLSETAYYILLSLAQELHGYAIMQNVEQITNGRIKLGAGTLYGTLGKMEKAEIIEPTGEEGRRKFYGLTELGKKILKQEILRLKELVKNGENYLEVLK